MMKKILIVEDEAMLRDAYSLVLGSVGYEVDEAANGLEATKKLKAFRPDVILLDLYMPIMDGKTFLENFDSEHYPHTTVIVCTNLSSPELEHEVTQLGAHKLVLKSDLGPKDLIALVKDY